MLSNVLNVRREDAGIEIITKEDLNYDETNKVFENIEGKISEGKQKKL